VTELRVHIPDDLARALDAHVSATAATTDAVVRAALESFLMDAGHTAFQVSTTGALVEGVYAGAAEVGHLRAHGDLGLGTFAGLDGELVVVDGRFLHVRSDGSVQDAPDSARTPFAVVTRFAPDARAAVPGGADLARLEATLDAHRDSENLFFAIRIDGSFEQLSLRAACRAAEGTPLAVATRAQAEWELADVRGTMVGFWSPAFSGRFDVPGYHLHFVDEARGHGGHVLGCRAGPVELAVQRLDRLAVELPETASFLAADLRADPAAALDRAEHGRSSPGRGAPPEPFS
jgi:acetolactate decarboxylase